MRDIYEARPVETYTIVNAEMMMSKVLVWKGSKREEKYMKSKKIIILMILGLMLSGCNGFEKSFLKENTMNWQMKGNGEMQQAEASTEKGIANEEGNTQFSFQDNVDLLGLPDVSKKIPILSLEEIDSEDGTDTIVYTHYVDGYNVISYGYNNDILYSEIEATYDKFGNIINWCRHDVVDGDLTNENYYYDERGNIIQLTSCVTVEGAAEADVRNYFFTYDMDGILIKVIERASGLSATYILTYNSDGTVKSIEWNDTDSSNYLRREYQYVSGYIQTEILTTGSDGGAHILTYTYDESSTQMPNCGARLSTISQDIDGSIKTYHYEYVYASIAENGILLEES